MPARRASILLLAAGLSVVLVVLALTFFNRIRAEMRAADATVQDAQARIMLHATLCYIQEASRLGYGAGDPLAWGERYEDGYPALRDMAYVQDRIAANPDAAKTPYRHGSNGSIDTTGLRPPAASSSDVFRPYGAASFLDHWTGGDENLRNALGEIYDERRQRWEEDPIVAESTYGNPHDAPDPTDPDPSGVPPLTDADGQPSAFGTYAGTAVDSKAFTRETWVGWYTPAHRGMYLTPWHAQDTDVLTWWKSYRQAPELWQPRLRSRPAQLDNDPNPESRGDRYDDVYFDGHRAELTGHWPLPHQGGIPKIFQMHVVEEPPFAVFAHRTHSGSKAARKWDSWNTKPAELHIQDDRRWAAFPAFMQSSNADYFMSTGTGQRNAQDLSYTDLVGKKVIRRFGVKRVRHPITGELYGIVGFMDPNPLYHPEDADLSMLVGDDPDDTDRAYHTGLGPYRGNAARWMACGTVLDFERRADGAIKTYDAAGNEAEYGGDPDGEYIRLRPKQRRDADGNVIVDGSGNPLHVMQSDPKPQTVDMAWFRIWRETHDTFIVTVGAGPSHGWRVRNGAIERRGIDVHSDEPCPFDEVDELRAAIEQERRLHYRVCWSPTVRVTRIWERLPQWCSQGGSIKYVQRLRAAEVAALPSQNKDW